MLAEVEALKEQFNEALLRLRHEKAELDITMVTADLKHITQFEELQLLKEFEKKETTFTSRYRTKKRERQEMEGKVSVALYVVSHFGEYITLYIHTYVRTYCTLWAGYFAQNGSILTEFSIFTYLFENLY